MATLHAIKPFQAKRILVTTDFSAFANTTLPMARALLSRGGKMRLLTVVHPIMAPSLAGPVMAVPVYDPIATDHAVASARKHLEALARQVRGVKIELAVLEGPLTAQAILREAKQWKADLVCLSTHGRSALKRIVFGSVAMKLMTLYPGRVLLLKPGFGRK